MGFIRDSGLGRWGMIKADCFRNEPASTCHKYGNTLDRTTSARSLIPLTNQNKSPQPSVCSRKHPSLVHDRAPSI